MGNNHPSSSVREDAESQPMVPVDLLQAVKHYNDIYRVKTKLAASQVKSDERAVGRVLNGRIGPRDSESLRALQVIYDTLKRHTGLIEVKVFEEAAKKRLGDEASPFDPKSMMVLLEHGAQTKHIDPSRVNSGLRQWVLSRVEKEKNKQNEIIEGHLRAVLVHELMERRILDLDFLHLTKVSTWFDSPYNMELTLERSCDDEPRHCLTQAIMDNLTLAEGSLNAVLVICNESDAKWQFKLVCLDSLIRRGDFWHLLTTRLGIRNQRGSEESQTSLGAQHEACLSLARKLIGDVCKTSDCSATHLDFVLKKMSDACEEYDTGLTEVFSKMFEGENEIKDVIVHAISHDKHRNIEGNHAVQEALKTASLTMDGAEKWVRALLKSYSDEECEQVLEQAFNLDLGEIEKYLQQRREEDSKAGRGARDSNKAEMPGEDKHFIPTAFHPKASGLETQNEDEKKKIEAWRKVFITRWHDIVKDLHQAFLIKKMTKSHEKLKRKLLAVFDGEVQVKYYFNHYIDYDTRLSAYEDIKKEWIKPFNAIHVIKAFFATMAWTRILFDLFDLLTDVVVVQNYHDQMVNPTPFNASTAFNSSTPGLDAVSRKVPRESYFGFSFVILFLPNIIEWFIFYFSESAELYLSHVAGFCCPRRAGPFILFLASLVAAPIQPIGTKLWAFIAVLRLKWARESEGKLLEIRPELPPEHDCQIRKGRGGRFTIRNCEDILGNATFLMAKTRLITTALESTYMPLLQTYAEFPRLLSLFQYLDLASFGSFTQSLWDHEYLVITLISISASILGMSWQQTMLNFSQSSDRAHSGSRSMFWSYFVKILLQTVSRILAITTLAYTFGESLPEPCQVVPPPFYIAVVLIAIQGLYFYFIGVLYSEKDTCKKEVLDAIFNTLSSVIVLRTKSFDEKAATFWKAEADLKKKPGRREESFGNKKYKVGLIHHEFFALFTYALLLLSYAFLHWTGETNFTGTEVKYLTGAIWVSVAAQTVSLQMKLAFVLLFDPWNEFYSAKLLSNEGSETGDSPRCCGSDIFHLIILIGATVADMAGLFYLSLTYWENGLWATVAVVLMLAFLMTAFGFQGLVQLLSEQGRGRAKHKSKLA